MWDWFVDFLDWLLAWPKAVVTWLLDLLTAVYLAIPTPDWITSAQGVLNAIPPSVVWSLSVLEVPWGFGVLLAAGVLRFAIRRLPFIG